MKDGLTIARLDRILEAGAALRLRSRLAPAGGCGDKVAPAVYDGGRYAVERRRIDGVDVSCVVLDSVQSQANRMEDGLLELRRSHRIDLPLVSVDFSHAGHPEIGSVTSLDAPHRIFDAILRDSLLEGCGFPESPLGQRLDMASNANATVLFECCPTSLLFGAWNSTGRRGGMGAKIGRSLVSEVVGIGASIGVGTRSRLDPLGILSSVEVYSSDDAPGWTTRPEAARQQSGGARPVAGRRRTPKSGRPSILNHSSITPSVEDLRGGVTIDFAEQIAVLSLASLRRLRFPIDSGEFVDRSAHRVLLSLGLVAALMARRSCQHLRSRCTLVPESPPVWEYLDGDGGPATSISLSLDGALTLYAESLAIAKAEGLPWATEEIVLEPSPQLVELVSESRRRWNASGRFEMSEPAA